MMLADNYMALSSFNLSVNCPAWLILSFNCRISSAVFNMFLMFWMNNYGTVYDLQQITRAF